MKKSHIICKTVSLIFCLFLVVTDSVFAASIDLFVISGLSQVVRFDGESGTSIGGFTNWPTGMGTLQDIVATPDGNFYVSAANDAGGSIGYIDGTSGAILNTFGESGLKGAFGLALGPDGDLFATYYDEDIPGDGAGTIRRYDGVTGTYEGVFANTGLAIYDITFGPDGDLYVGENTGSEIFRIDGTTGAASLFAYGPGDGMHGLTFGLGGDLYVSSQLTDQVLRYDGNTGAFKGVFASGGGLNQPSYLVFGPDGDLYVSSAYVSSAQTGQVLRYDGVTGEFVEVFASTSIPRGLTFSSTIVPIPPTLWLFGSGLLGLVGMARRRKAA